MIYPPFDGDSNITRLRLPTPPRGFWWLLALALLMVFFFFVASPAIAVAAELLWFKGIGLQEVYATRLGYQFWLFFGSFLLAAAFSISNVLVALRLRKSSALRTIGIRRRYVGTPAGVVGIAAAVLVALILAAGAAAQWQSLALFLNGQPTGTTEPVFGLDVSFYLFTLPILQAALGWALGLTFMTALLVGGLYAWRDTDFELRLPTRGIAHVSVLLALVALALAAGAYVGRYELLYQHNGYTWGAGWTDINARIPIAYIATAIGLLLAVALVANGILRRLWLPVVALAVWIVFGIVSTVYAQAVQRLIVAPQEFTREEPYIARGLKFTRQAFNIDKVKVSEYAGDAPLTARDIADDRTTIDNLRLWDQLQLAETYPQLQAIRTYYSLNKIDLDRYTVNGRYEQLELSARELDTQKLPTQARNFVNEKLTYTHGYGVVASPVRSVVGEGLPDLVLRDIPPRGDIKIDQPAIYFGAEPSGYVLAPSQQKEFDYPLSGGDAYTNYQGTHGVPLGGASRLLFAAYTGDLNLLITSQVNSRTQILFRRNVTERVKAIAPFLTFDQDPYIVVADGKLYWIIDGYTTATTYPYSQRESDINYMRNSVKVVVDAYEGTADFYVADDSDPILRSYRRLFPTLFKPFNQLPAGLLSHIRYPEDLFTIQATVYQAYHMTRPQAFYNREDVWAKPEGQNSPTTTHQLQPYYVLMRLPGQTQPEYLLILPFVPNNRQNMISWLAARNDVPDYGQLVLYQLPKDKVVYGPQQIGNRIQANGQISAQFTLWNQSGSQVQQGNLLVVPVGQSFLYFEPIYLRASGTSSLPEFKKVILADSQNVVWDDTLEGALAQLSGGPISASPGSGQPPPSGGTSPTPGPAGCGDLVRAASQHYQAAQDRLRAGDLAGYAAEIKQVGDAFNQLQTAGCAGSAGPTAKPSASPSPTR